MRIAVSASSHDIDAQVDPRFGRAAFFLMVDSETLSFDAVENKQNHQAAQGAGIQAAQNVADKNVTLAISGNFGPKAFDTLKAAGIGTAIISNGTISDVIELFKNKKLKIINGANVDGHWV